VNSETGHANHYDAVLIPGGGFTAAGALHDAVCARLLRALEEPGEPALIPLSRGTVHKPPPVDNAGFPVTEAGAAASFLIRQGCKPRRIATETCSLDTIGNAYFARVVHTEPAGYRRLLVVTSEFHLPRAQCIFEHIFGIDAPAQPYQLHFAGTPDTGYRAEALAARRLREEQSLATWRQSLQRLPSLAALHRWLFTQHTAYATGKESDSTTGPDLQTY